MRLALFEQKAPSASIWVNTTVSTLKGKQNRLPQSDDDAERPELD